MIDVLHAHGPDNPSDGDRQPPRMDIFDHISSMPGHLLRRCQQIAVSVFLNECRTFDITPLQFSILSTLAQAGPLDQAGIGGYAALDRTTVSLVVRKLEQRGLVHRQVSEKDRRSRLITISPEGEALLHTVLPVVEAAQDRMLSPLTGAERQRLVGLLRKMADGNNRESRAPLRT